MFDIASTVIRASIPGRLTNAGIDFHTIVIDGALRYRINGALLTPGDAVDLYLN